jgi:ABC-type sugar transport system ATPase subunit
MSLTVRHNINISSYGDIANLGFIRRKDELSRAKKLVDALNIYTPSIEQVVNNLSGGNQQKVVIAKWFAKNVDVLILDEPTTGVDVGAKVEIYSLIEGLIQQGKAVIIVSSYLAEVMGLADRILVMAEGDFMGEVRREDADEELLVSMACKVTLNSAAH